MQLDRVVKLTALGVLAPAMAVIGLSASATAAPRAAASAVAAPTTTVPPGGPGGLTTEGDQVGVVTWCHGDLQCLVVGDLCAGIFVYDEVNGAGEPTHGYCDDNVEASVPDGRALAAAPKAQSRGMGPILGARCPEGTFLSPFEEPVYDDDGLFVVGYETTWYCLPEDLEPSG
ncbi:MAG: hypothetical protein GEV08_01995 [Acidimicrobiia bacterium]|nr:hypothetical protein [Acidimicrobiia bacterium]